MKMEQQNINTLSLMTTTFDNLAADYSLKCCEQAMAPKFPLFTKKNYSMLIKTSWLKNDRF